MVGYVEQRGAFPLIWSLSLPEKAECDFGACFITHYFIICTLRECFCTAQAQRPTVS